MLLSFPRSIKGLELTIGNVDVNEGKDLAVLERAVLLDVEAVAGVEVSACSRSTSRINSHSRRVRQVEAVLPDTSVANVGVLSIRREGNA